MQFHPKDLSEFDELTEEQLGFSALSDGLGFTKNSEKAKSQPTHGAGATVAGAARVSPSITKPATAKASTATNPLVEPAAPRLLRSAAFFTDLLIVAVPLLAAWGYSFGSQSWELFAQDPVTPLALLALVLFVYFLLSESFGGQSLAKMIYGLRVVEDDKYQKPIGFNQALFRIFLFVFGALFLAIGLLSSLFEYKRRPWQDRFSGTIVRKK